MNSFTRSGECVVFVVDDDHASRLSVAAYVGAHGYRVQTFDSGEAFLDAYDGNTCGIVISDYRMPGMDGLELQQRLAEQDLPLPIIIVSGYADVPTAVRALRGGALTLLEKPYDQATLLSAVNEASRVAEEWFRVRRRNQEAHERLATLRDGEREVMQMILDGYANKTIASRLDISLRTVERRRHDILDKLGATSLVDLSDLVKDAGSYPWRVSLRGLALSSAAEGTT